MERDERVFLIGEDIGLYGGVFKATKGLQDKFGPERVIDSPISEAYIAGGSVGAAMVGMSLYRKFSSRISSRHRWIS